MSANIQVWVKDLPGERCHQCELTTDYLERNEIPFEQRGLSEASAEQMEEFRRIGTSAPIVLTDNYGNWAGLRPEKLREVKKAHRTMGTPPNTSPAIHQLASAAGAAGASM